MPKLPHDQPHQPSRSWRIGRLQSRKELHRADLQHTNSLWETSPAPVRPPQCLQGHQEGLRQGLACSFVDNREEVPHQRQPYPSRQTPLWQGHQGSPLQRHHRRLIPNNSWSPTGMFTLTHSLQHVFGKDHDRRLRRSRLHSQHWKQNNHQFPLCWWHRWLSRKGRGTGGKTTSGNGLAWSTPTPRG